MSAAQAQGASCGNRVCSVDYTHGPHLHTAHGIEFTGPSGEGPTADQVYRAWHGTEEEWAGCADSDRIARVMRLFAGHRVVATAAAYEDGYDQGHADAHADGAAEDRVCRERKRADEAEARVAQVVALHVPDEKFGLCTECRQGFPCDTRVALGSNEPTPTMDDVLSELDVLDVLGEDYDGALVDAASVIACPKCNRTLLTSEAPGTHFTLIHEIDGSHTFAPKPADHECIDDTDICDQCGGRHAGIACYEEP